MGAGFRLFPAVFATAQVLRALGRLCGGSVHRIRPGHREGPVWGVTFHKATLSGTMTPLGAHGSLPGQERLHEEGSELWEWRRVGKFHKTSGDPKGKAPGESVRSSCVPRFKRPVLLLLNENIYIKYTLVVFLNIRCGNWSVQRSLCSCLKWKCSREDVREAEHKEEP